MTADSGEPGGEPLPDLLGAVLAGGVSRRYGAEKSGARVGGVPMVQRVLAAARAVCPEVRVVSPRAVAGAETAPRIADRVPGRGPLGGLHAALLAARERGRSGVLLLACDLPLVTPRLLRRLLLEAGRQPDAPVLALQREDAPPEVTCAVYGLSTLAAVEARLDGDDVSLQGLFRSVGGRVLHLDAEAHEAALLNVNTPEDRRRAQARVEGDPGEADPRGPDGGRAG